MIRGGKHRRYLNWEKIRDFIVKQNDARGGAFGLDYYDKKAKDLVKKYTQHDKQFLHKGFSRLLSLLLLIINSRLDRMTLSRNVG